MGFRPNCFTCIAHLYLYYTLLVPHTYASYIRHWCTFFHEEIQYNLPVFLTWYQNHCFDFFLAVLSLLVLLHSQHRFCHHNRRCSLSPLNLRRLPSLSLGSGPAAAIVEESNTAQVTTHVIPPWLLLRSNLWWYHWDRLETIYSSVKALPSSELPRTSRAAWIFCINAPRAPCATCTIQSSSWRHLWRHLLHVSPSCISIRHLLTSTPRHLGDVICWLLTALTVDFDWPMTLTIDFLPELTFAVQVLLTQFFA